MIVVRFETREASLLMLLVSVMKSIIHTIVSSVSNLDIVTAQSCLAQLVLRVEPYTPALTLSEVRHMRLRIISHTSSCTHCTALVQRPCDKVLVSGSTSGSTPLPYVTIDRH